MQNRVNPLTAMKEASVTKANFAQHFVASTVLRMTCQR